MTRLMREPQLNRHERDDTLGIAGFGGPFYTCMNSRQKCKKAKLGNYLQEF